MATISITRETGPALSASAEAWVLAIFTVLNPPDQDRVLQRVAKIDREGVREGAPDSATFSSPLAAKRQQ